MAVKMYSMLFSVVTQDYNLPGSFQHVWEYCCDPVQVENGFSENADNDLHTVVTEITSI